MPFGGGGESHTRSICSARLLRGGSSDELMGWIQQLERDAAAGPRDLRGAANMAAAAAASGPAFETGERIHEATLAPEHRAARAEMLLDNQQAWDRLGFETPMAVADMRAYEHAPDKAPPHNFLLKRVGDRFLMSVERPATLNGANGLKTVSGHPMFMAFGTAAPSEVPDGASDSHGAAKAAAMAATFGRPMFVQPVNQFEDRSRTHIDGSDVYDRHQVETSQFMINHILSERLWHFEVVAPWKFAGNMRSIEFEQWHFHDHIGKVTAYESLVRLVQHRKERYSYEINRFGLGHMQEMEAFMTRKGRWVWNMQQMQLINGMVTGAMLGVILELVSCQAKPSSKFYKRRLPGNDADFRRELLAEVGRFNAFMKPTGPEQIMHHIKEVFERVRGVRGTPVLIIPEDAAFWLRALPTRTEYWKSGIKQQDLQDWDRPPSLPYVGNRVFIQPPIMTTSWREEDFMHRYVTIGLMRSMNTVRDSLHYTNPTKYNSGLSRYRWYCDDTDAYHETTLSDFINWSCIYHDDPARGGVTPLGVDVFKQKIPGFTGARKEDNILAYWRACKVSEEHLAHTFHGVWEKILRRTPKDQDATIAAAKEAEGWLSKKLLGNRQTWLDLIHHNVPFPFCGLEFAPHVTHRTALAIACMAGCATTWIRPPMYLVGQDRLTGIMKGSAWWHIRTTVNNPNSVYIVENILAAGYGGGNNPSWWNYDDQDVYKQIHDWEEDTDVRLRRKSRFAVWQHPGEGTPEPGMFMDITGHIATGLRRSREAEYNSVGETGPLYAEFWGWKATPVMSDLCTPFFNNPMDKMNTLVFQDLQLHPGGDGATNAQGFSAWNRVVTAKGHFRNFTYQGCSGLRSGVVEQAMDVVNGKMEMR